MLFEVWGLSFGLVATPSDLIVGAVEAVPMILVVLSYAAIGFLVAQESSRDIADSKVLRRLVYLGFGLILFFGLAERGIISVFDSYELNSVSRILMVGRNAVSLFVVVAIMILLKHYPNKMLYLSLFSAFGLIFFSNFKQASARYKDETVLLAESDRCGNAEFVVWSGSNSVVTSCSPPPFSEGNRYFVIPRADAAFSTQRNKTGKKNNAQTH